MTNRHEQDVLLSNMRQTRQATIAVAGLQLVHESVDHCLQMLQNPAVLFAEMAATRLQCRAILRQVGAGKYLEI